MPTNSVSNISGSFIMRPYYPRSLQSVAGTLSTVPSSPVGGGTTASQAASRAARAMSSRLERVQARLIQLGLKGRALEQYMGYARRILRIRVGGGMVNYVISQGKRGGLSEWVLWQIAGMA